MKKKEREELYQKSLSDLENLLSQKQKQLLEARFERAKRKLKNVHLLSQIRDEIALIKMVIAQKRRENG